MADIIDAFVVSLGIDSREYTEEIRKFRADRKNLAEENDQYNRDERDGQKKTVEGLRKIRNETAGFLLMLAGASSLAGFAKDMLTADANTGRFAKNVGMATERVSVWENALKQVGGTAQEAQQVLGTLFGIFQNYQLLGDNSKGGALAYFGLSERDLKDPEAALLRISDVVKNMPREDVQARLETLGLSGSIVGILSGDRGDLRQLLKSIEDAGVATDESAEAAANLEAEMAKTAQTIQGLARPAITELANEFIKLTKIVQDLLSPLGVVKEWLDWFAGSNAGKMVGGGDYKNFWDYVGDAVGGEGGQAVKDRWGAEGKSGGSAAGGGGAGSFTGGGFGFRPSEVASYAAGMGSGGGGRRGKLTRAERNNNPGNIEDGPFARRQPGYAGGDGRFAKFATADAGFGAMENLLMGRGYMGGGRNTIQSIISKYAPSSENNVGAYAGAVERATGIDRNARLTAAQIKAVSRAMARHEGYRGGSVDVHAAAAQSRNLRTPAGGAAGRGGNTTTSSTTTIGQVVVYTPADKADGIARDIRGELAKRDMVVQGGSGLKP